jgi:hypothetical protein
VRVAPSFDSIPHISTQPSTPSSTSSTTAITPIAIGADIQNRLLTMSTGFPYRRHIGRAASPPLFQIYDLPITQPLSRSPSPSDESDSDESDCSSSSSSSKHSSSSAPAAPEAGEPSTVAHDTDDHCKVTEDADTEKELAEKARLEEEIEEKRRRREKRKGKQRDDGTTLDRKARRRQRDDPDTVYSYRPILTIRYVCDYSERLHVEPV